jgi:ADP-heptose:LPS heptosyltransferase
MGVGVKIIGSTSDRSRLSSLASGLDVVYIWGENPQNLSTLILGANLVLGNDSGIVHFAGLLGVPTISVHAGSLPHEFLYNLAYSVQSVVAGHFQRSDHFTEALHSISVDQVLKAAKGFLLPKQ